MFTDFSYSVNSVVKLPLEDMSLLRGGENALLWWDRGRGDKIRLRRGG